MDIIVSIFADNDLEFSVDSYRYTGSPDKFSFDDIITDAQKRFGDNVMVVLLPRSSNTHSKEAA